MTKTADTNDDERWAMLRQSIDPDFATLPLREMAEAALARARELGAEHADFRCERIRGQEIRLRDGELEGASDSVDAGISVRVVHEGTWGFAGATLATPEAAARLAEQAVQVARVSAPVNSEPVVLAPEPSHGEQTWISDYEIDPFDVSDAEKIGLLEAWSKRVLAAPGVDHVSAYLQAVKENKFYADLGGTVTTQQRVRIHPVVEAVSVDKSTGAFESMRTLAPRPGTAGSSRPARRTARRCGIGTPSWSSCRGCWRRRSPRRRWSRAGTTW